MIEAGRSRQLPRTAVVTGAARGIGAAAAARLREDGWRVVGWDLDDMITADLPHLDVGEQLDVTDPQQVRTAAARIGDTSPALDLLVNAAGILLVAQLAEVDASAVQRLFAVNILGPTLTTQALLEPLTAAHGAVVNVCSNTALRPVSRNAHYAASKAALLHLTRSWAAELAPHGVRVNAVCPGAVPTELFSVAGMSDGAVQSLLTSANAPAIREGTTRDVAEWIVHLGAPGSWVTGAHIAVDGGSSVSH